MRSPMASAARTGIRPRAFHSSILFTEAGGACKSMHAVHLDRATLIRLNLAEIIGIDIIVNARSESAATDKSVPIEARVARLLGGRTLVMVGMMGAGKSSVGRRLAARLSINFSDADSEIEKAANATINEIFERHGEAYFRDGERRVIQRLLDGKQKVLATGGGAFINPETRAAIMANAISIWLMADRDVLMSRVKRRSNRPLLKTDDPEAVIQRLLDERNPYYAEATIHVQSRDVAHDVVIDEILLALANHLETEATAEI